MHFHGIAPGIRSPGELENNLTQIIDDVLALWSYGELSAKFLVSSVKVLMRWDSCRFLLLLVQKPCERFFPRIYLRSHPYQLTFLLLFLSNIP